MEPPSPDSTRSEPACAPPPGNRLQQLLMQLWTTSKTTIALRLETIRQAQTLLENNVLDEPGRFQAQDAAHKLAGILGTFGLPEGTELARHVEILLEQAGRPELVDARALAVTLNVTLDQLSEMIQKKSDEIPCP